MTINENIVRCMILGYPQVAVMNHLLTDTIKELDSSECHRRQGVTECIHSIVKVYIPN